MIIHPFSSFRRNCFTCSLFGACVNVDSVGFGILFLEHLKGVSVTLSVGLEEDRDWGCLEEREGLEVRKLSSEELDQLESEFIVLESIDEIAVLLASLSE